MTQTNSGSGVNMMRLILVPSVITLALTLLRLVGELNHWSEFWFNRAPGGGGSPLGISWLPIIFGVYFGLKLSKEGIGPASPVRVILFSILAIVIIVGASAISFTVISSQPTPLSIGVLTVAAIVALLVQSKPWPELFRTLLAYGYAARIPVAILMFFAIKGSWGTHYDVPPNDQFPEMSWFMKWIIIGAVPQLVFWILVTVTVGLLSGAISVALFHRGRQRSQTAHA